MVSGRLKLKNYTRLLHAAVAVATVGIDKCVISLLFCGGSHSDEVTISVSPFFFH